MVLQPAVQEGGVEEADASYFFKYAGGLQFTKPGQPLEAPGSARMLVCAARHGLVVFSDLEGVYAARVPDLFRAASKDVGLETYRPPSPATVCVCQLTDSKDVGHLSLSADELVLACAAQNSVSFYSVPGLVQGGQAPKPVLQLTLNSSATQFLWCKDAAHCGRYLVVTEENELLAGEFPAPPLPALDSTQPVLSADWSPHGSHVAVVTDNNVSLYEAGKWAACMAKVEVTHPDVEDVSQLRVESVVWLEPATLLLCASQVVDDAEGQDVYPMQLVLGPPGWTPSSGPPTELTLYSYIPVMIEEGCTPALQGPYLHAAAVQPWGAVLAAHRKANDEHTLLFQLGGAEGATQLLVTEDTMRIALPSGPDGEDNFVLGLAVDTTADEGPLPHPSDREAPPVPACPTMLVLTSDAVLRLYRFGHLDPPVAVLHPAAPLPAAAPAWAAVTSPPATGGAQGQGSEDEQHGIGRLAVQPEAAAQVGLPESDIDDEDDWGSDRDASPAVATPTSVGTGTPPGAQAGSQPVARSAAAHAAGLAALSRAAAAATPGGLQVPPAAATGHVEARAAATALPDSDSEGESDSRGAGGEGSEEDEEGVGESPGPATPSQGRDAGSPTVTEVGAGLGAQDGDSEEEVTSSRAPAAGGQPKRQGSPATHPHAKATSLVPASASGLHTTVPARQDSSSMASSSAVFSLPPSASQHATGLGSGATVTSGGFSAGFGGLGGLFGTGTAPTAPAFGGGTTPPAFGLGSSTTVPAFGLGSGSTAPAFGLGAGFGGGFGSGLTPPATTGGGLFGSGLTSTTTSTPPGGTAAASADANGTAPAPGGLFNFASNAAPAASTAGASTAGAAGFGGSGFGGAGFGGAGFGLGGTASSAPATASTGFGATGLGAGQPSWLAAPASGTAASAGGAGGLFAPPASVLTPQATDTFNPATAWQGPRPGWYFTRGPNGQGYYKDTAPPVSDPATQGTAGAEPSPPVTAVPAAPAPAPALTGPTGATASATRGASTAAAVTQKRPPTTAADKPAAGTLKPPVPASPPAPKAPPPKPAVPAPKPKLAGESPEIASIESDFLQCLHDVRKMSADTSALVADVRRPDDPATGHLSAGAAGPLGVACRGEYVRTHAAIQDLVARAGALKQDQDSTNQTIARVAGCLPELDRSVAGLQLLQPGNEQGGAMARAAQMLPLEPALASLQARATSQLQGISRCMDELGAHLDALEDQRTPRASAPASTASAAAGTGTSLRHAQGPGLGGRTGAGGGREAREEGGG